MARSKYQSTLFATTALSLGMVGPTHAQAVSGGLEEIIVTARRVEERLQDVPISMTVYNQQELANANIVNASDLAMLTPGLIANERFGADNSSFAIRGFTQELRTTPSVGVYFADVVAPRGGYTTTSGDGAGPGAFFDLQNVQVLRGPQGTLFGRNTTGGAVVLVPQRPTGELEGYLEGSAGDYDMLRGQAVLNVPVSDSVRLRFGLDRQKRDGYLNNISATGPDDFANVDYIAARASMAIDLTPNIENYTIATYTDSSNNGTLSQVFACNPTPTGLPRPAEMQMCQGALGGNALQGDFYDVQNPLPDPKSEIKQWQAINTTTWMATDNLTVKNILSFANLETELVSGVAGTDWQPSDITTSLLSAAAPWIPPAASPHRYIPLMAGVVPGQPTVAQDTFVEELQLQGRAFDSRLTWQAGLYYEHSKPSNKNQAGQSVGNLICDLSTIGSNPDEFMCADTRYIAARASGLPASVANNFTGVVNRAVGWTEFENKAVYTQGTFDFTDQLSLTGGLRYTWDETTGQMRGVNYFFYPDAVPVGNASSASTLVRHGDLDQATRTRCSDTTLTHAGNDANCTVDMEQKSDAPTWLLGLDYKPMDDVLIYGKYARGYRQGGVNIASVPGGYTYEPEEVDTYEIGAKTGFGGPVPGTFNIALFYNDFTDQQLQLGLLPVGGVGTTAIVNTGASTIQGAEVEARLELFEGFALNLAYTYLDSEVEEAEHLITAGNPAVCGGGPAFGSVCVAGGTTAALVGYPTAFSPEHQASGTMSYRLPTPTTVGDITLSATYNYTSKYFAVMPLPTLTSPPSTYNPYAEIPGYGTLNLNLNWNGIAGSSFDASVFATNVLDEEYWTFVAGQYFSTAYEYRQLGRPKMIGGRLRYNF